MQVARQYSFAGYYGYLQSNKSEVHDLFSDLLISVISLRRLFALFHYALKPSGYVFLGSAETIDAGQALFFNCGSRRPHLSLGDPRGEELGMGEARPGQGPIPPFWLSRST